MGRINCVCCDFVVVAGDYGPNNQQGREEKKKAGHIRLFSGVEYGGAWVHTPPVAMAYGADAPPLFAAPEAFQHCSRALFLHVLEALGCFRGCFVILNCLM